MLVNSFVPVPAAAKPLPAAEPIITIHPEILPSHPSASSRVSLRRVLHSTSDVLL